jgi:hypothetical protein
MVAVLEKARSAAAPHRRTAFAGNPIADFLHDGHPASCIHKRAIVERGNTFVICRARRPQPSGRNVRQPGGRVLGRRNVTADPVGKLSGWPLIPPLPGENVRKLLRDHGCAGRAVALNGDNARSRFPLWATLACAAVLSDGGSRFPPPGGVQLLDLGDLVFVPHDLLSSWLQSTHGMEDG